jgi:tight adherence protein C
MDYIAVLTSFAFPVGGTPIPSGAATGLVLLFVGLVALVIGMGGLFFATDVIGRRLAAATSARPTGTAHIGLRPVEHREHRWLHRLLMPTGERRSRTRDKMVRAGYRSPHAPMIFYTVRFVLTLLVPFILSLTLPILLRNLSYNTIVLMTAMSATVGFLLPSAWIDRRIEQRQEQIRNGFPDALDMLLVCVEAGLGLDAALQRMSLEIGKAHPIIEEEFAAAGAEVRAGKGRTQSLRDLAHRVAVDEVSSFVTILSHAERFGSSVADSLRVYAAEMRAKRLVRAEEKANQLPVKLSLAVGFCTVPAMIIIIMAPAIVTVTRGLGLLIRNI